MAEVIIISDSDDDNDTPGPAVFPNLPKIYNHSSTSDQFVSNIHGFNPTRSPAKTTTEHVPSLRTKLQENLDDTFPILSSSDSDDAEDIFRYSTKRIEKQLLEYVEPEIEEVTFELPDLDLEKKIHSSPTKKRQQPKAKPLPKSPSKSLSIDKLSMMRQKKTHTSEAHAVDKLIRHNSDEIHKSTRPGEAIKLMRIILPSSLAQKDEIAAFLVASEIRYEITSNTTLENGITFKREIIYQAMGSDLVPQKKSKLQDEDQIFLIMEAEDIILKLYAQIHPEEASGNVDLITFLKYSQETCPGKLFTILLLGMDKYFSRLKKNAQQEFRKRVLDGGEINSRKPRNRRSELPVISHVEFQSGMVDVQLETKVTCRQVKTIDELCRLLVKYTKAIADAPFKRQQKENGFDWFASVDTSGSVKIEKDGKGLKTLWLEQLQLFGHVGLDIAQAVANIYPTPKSLIQAYTNCETPDQAINLFRDVTIRFGVGPLAKERKIGPDLQEYGQSSKKFYHNSGATLAMYFDFPVESEDGSEPSPEDETCRTDPSYEVDGHWNSKKRGRPKKKEGTVIPKIIIKGIGSPGYERIELTNTEEKKDDNVDHSRTSPYLEAPIPEVAKSPAKGSRKKKISTSSALPQSTVNNLTSAEAPKRKPKRNSGQNSLNGKLGRPQWKSADWDEYLSDRNNLQCIPPVTAFKYAPFASVWENFAKIGVKVEVPNPFISSPKSTNWVATLRYFAGYKTLIQFEGFGYDPDHLGWINFCSSIPHSIGFSDREKILLYPPFDVAALNADFLEKMRISVEDCETISPVHDKFVVDELKKSQKYKMQSMLEVLDRDNISRMRVGTVTGVIGTRIHVTFPNTSNQDDVGHWYDVNSESVQPIGWSQTIGLEISGADKSHRFSPLKAVNFPKYPTSIVIAQDQMLEARHPLRPHQICVAQVRKVLKYGYFVAEFRSVTSDSEPHTLFTFHVTSPYALPCGFCEEYQIPLENGFGPASEPLNWDIFLENECLEPLALRLLPNRAPHNFKVSMKVEASAILEPSYIGPATIKNVCGHLLYMKFDGASTDFHSPRNSLTGESGLEFWTHSESAEIYPIGYSEMVGLNLQGRVEPTVLSGFDDALKTWR